MQTLITTTTYYAFCQYLNANERYPYIPYIEYVPNEVWEAFLNAPLHEGLGFLEYILIILRLLVLVVPLLLSVAFFTVLERKLISYIQRRKGPNVVGPLGLLQAIADGAKLLSKETILPSHSNVTIFVLSPVVTFGLSLFSWVVVPFAEGLNFLYLDLGVLYIFAISSLGVYGVVLAGWSSNSKYALLGALRATAQMISYEVSIGFILISVLISAGSLDLSKIVIAQSACWYCIPHSPMFVLFCISALAETNRHPFDFAEAESELVSGYNVEYSSMVFALFFLAEYANMLLMSALIVIFFVGGWLGPILPPVVWFAFKTLVFVSGFILVRAYYPRLRYDQLMAFGWKVSLPVSLAWVVFTATILTVFDGLPPAGGYLYGSESSFFSVGDGNENLLYPSTPVNLDYFEFLL